MQRVAEGRKGFLSSAFLRGPLRLCVKISLALVAALPRRVPGLAQRAPGDGPLHPRQLRSPKNESWQSPPIPASQSQTPAFGQE